MSFASFGKTRFGGVYTPFNGVRSFSSRGKVKQSIKTGISVVSSQTYQNNTELTSRNINLPSDINIGNTLILIVVIAPGVITTFSTPSGWDLIQDINQGSDSCVGIYKRVVDGTEAGFATFETSVAAGIVAITYEISGSSYSRIESQMVETNLADPPSISASWGVLDNLFITFATTSRSNRIFTNSPINYTNFIEVRNPESGATTTASMGASYRKLSSETDNPGVFTFIGSLNRGVAGTIVIGPI